MELRGPCEVLNIVLRLALCKASILPSVLSVPIHKSLGGIVCSSTLSIYGWVIGFLLLSFVIVLYILEIAPLSYTLCVNVFYIECLFVRV